NAHKHGNSRDPAKVISVELVLTGKGALITITDEGNGFDAALALRRFQTQEKYFANHGCGFHNLHRAKSMVSYENGGSSLLLCFQPSLRSPRRSVNGATRDLAAQSATSEHARAEASPGLSGPDPQSGRRRCQPLAKLLDPLWIQTCLSALPEFGNG